MKLSRYCVLLLMVVSVQSSAEIIIPPEAFPKRIENNTHSFLRLQIVQDQMVFDNNNVERATLKYNQKGLFVGLLIELKPFAATNLAQITENNVGRCSVELVIDNKVVSSHILQTALGKRFFIVSISKDEAQQFLNSLNSNKNNRLPNQTQKTTLLNVRPGYN